MVEPRPKVVSIAEKETEKVIDGAIVSPGSYVDEDLEVPSGKTGLALTVRATYDASATQGVQIEVYYSPDGTNYDTDTDEVYDHPFEAGKTKQKTHVIQCVHPYVRIRIKNLDSSYAVTVSAWVTFI